MTDLVALVADLIPRPLPHNVGDWPEKERDYYRSYPGSFTDSTEALDRMRRERAARAILAALGISSVVVCEGHSDRDLWTKRPDGAFYADGCRVPREPA